jgi:hypothetical protein
MFDFILLRSFDCLQLRVTCKDYRKDVDYNIKQTHSPIYLTSVFNFLKQTAFNLHCHVLKASFRKLHPQPQSVPPVGCE